MARLSTFLTQPWQRQRLVLEVMALLLWAWFLVRLFPFRRYASRLGEARPGEYSESAPQNLTVLRDVRWAVEAVNRTYGGRFTCLMQCMAGKAVLNRRGVPNTLVLGAKINREEDDGEGSGMAAHAWLWAGERILLGGEARAGFVPVTSYHSA